MSKPVRIWLLAGVLIIATFFRFYHLTTTPPGLYPDEAMDGNNALEVIETHNFQPFYVEDNGREGLYVNILVFAISWLGNEPWVVRLPAAVAGVLTVWGVYLLVAELFIDSDKKQPTGNKNHLPLTAYRYQIALLAAFLLATSFWHINFSRIGFRAILSPFLLTWGLYFLIKCFRTKSAIGYWLSAIAGGIVYGLGFYTYIAFRVTPLLLLLLIPFFKTTKDFWKKCAVFIVVTFLVAAPIGWYFVKNPSEFFGRTSEISVTSSQNPIETFAVNVVKTALMFNFRGDSNWRQNVSGAPELWWPVGILFLLGIVLSAIWLIKAWKIKKTSPSPIASLTFPLLLTFSWFILGLLPEIFSDEGIPHALRSIVAVVPTMIFAAVGGVWLYEWMKRHWNPIAAKTAAIVFAAVITAYAYYDYFIVWAENPNVPGAFNADYVTIGNEINALPASIPKYVVVNAGGVLARGIPVPAETVMYVTDSFTIPDQTAKNIHYLLPDETSTIPAGTPENEVFMVN